MANKISLEQMISIVDGLHQDPKLLNLYKIGDKISRGQTKHDLAHAINVQVTAEYLEKELSLRFPEKLSELSRKVIIPAAAFFHDIGRADPFGDHALQGSKITTEYLEAKKFPEEVIGAISDIVSRHRSKTFRKILLEDLRTLPELSLIVIADKCVGDEDRVRWNKSIVLKVLRFLGLAKLNLWKNSVHDRVNFAIKQSSLIVDSDEIFDIAHAGAMILKLTMDEKVATGQELMNLYMERFHACVLGAKSLGFEFRVEVNGIRFHFDECSDSWLLNNCFSIRPTHSRQSC